MSYRKLIIEVLHSIKNERTLIRIYKFVLRLYRSSSS